MDNPPPDLPPTPPPAPSSERPPRSWSGWHYAGGFAVCIPLIWLLGIVLGPVGFMIAFAAIIGTGITIGIKRNNWSFLLGSVTCIAAVPLVLFVICLVNPPQF